MKRFVIGDIHGNHLALKDVIESSSINKEEDLLICLGDIVDGYPDVKECVSTLLTFKNLVFVLGNHDKWFVDFLKHNKRPPIWVDQGGYVTLVSYGNNVRNVPDQHKQLFLQAAVPYYELADMLFVHAGYNQYRPIDQQNEDDLRWDRDFIREARLRGDTTAFTNSITYDKVFVGHTALKSVLITPKVIGLDTGAGFNGVLTIMNIDTLDYFSSKPAYEYYDYEVRHETAYMKRLIYRDW